MRKFVTFAAIATALSLPVASAQANGWGGYSSHNNHSSGLINVSPSVKTGNISVLSGILNNSPILSGNSILSGNNVGVGVLGTGTGLLNNVIGGQQGKKRR